MESTTATNKRRRMRSVDRSAAKAFSNYKPPEDLTVSQWAEKFRILSRESSAEAGPWRNARTPYLIGPMDAFTDPAVSTITVVAASQVGKSELELNMIGYIIDQDPGSIIYVQPNLEDARKFSRQRIAPMFRASPRLRSKVSDVKSRDSGNTILQKSFPGGLLTIVGSQSASALASTPARYVIGDEIDRWALSAGTEGDPWKLAEARTTTYYNAKKVRVSTPTTKGQSKIAEAFDEGTQERWSRKCPHCGEWHDIVFDDIKFEFDTIKVGHKTDYIVKSVAWCCPSCGCLSSEEEVRNQPARWIAHNSQAIRKGHRSFWLNAFSSPWVSWASIVYEFLCARKDPEKLKVVYNTKLGLLWEDRGDLEDEDTMLSRREDYGTREDGSPVELPEGVLVLTCGVDTQDDRLEYEVVGWGRYKESWGIKKGMIWGDPNDTEVWQRLDDVIDHEYRFKDGLPLKISRTFVDSGGHKTQSVYKNCLVREHKRVYAIKGSNQADAQLTERPKKNAEIVLNGKTVAKTWLYHVGVNAAKADLLKGFLRVVEPGPGYCHFNNHPDAGYDFKYFVGLLSETEETKTIRGKKTTTWRVLPGHDRNEPLDIRNYAYAALNSLDPDMFAVEKRLMDRRNGKKQDRKSIQQPTQTRRSKTSRSRLAGGDDW